MASNLLGSVAKSTGSFLVGQVKGQMVQMIHLLCIFGQDYIQVAEQLVGQTT